MEVWVKVFGKATESRPDLIDRSVWANLKYPIEIVLH
jgi:hypothetical protein